MNTGDIIQSRFAKALKNQQGQSIYTCPYPDHGGRIFQTSEQLYDHGKTEHTAEFEGLDARQARAKYRELSSRFRSDHSSIATAGEKSAPDIAALTLESETGSRQNSPPSGRKRPAEHEFSGRKGKAPSHIEIADSDYSRHIPHTLLSDRIRPKAQDIRLFNPKQATRGTTSPYRTTPEPSSEWSAEATKSTDLHSLQTKTTIREQQRNTPKDLNVQRQPGLIELERYDARYPGLLLQPDSRPISQEQLASEVKSIYAGLTMVETKCIHVDRAQAAAVQDPETKLAPDHWQALIALHRTLLHEHHDFFLASQHPSASPALRRLAGKYSMPARMWKHGIHSFLELLRRRLPESIDYMLAFIYLAYQMMALLYETVPAFEDTWIECLGDLGRYRMAIEDEDVRDRDIWAGVARSWYSKAADKNPTVGRLYHHLAILARPNALLQMYYYSRSLTCVKPFGSARDSILTLLDPILGRAPANLTHALPIDNSFIKSHALQFTRSSVKVEERDQPSDAVSDARDEKKEQPSAEFLGAKAEFMDNLDNHVGRVTAKWKEQGVYVAVTNIAGWFNYGEDSNILRQVLLTEMQQQASHATMGMMEQGLPRASPNDQHDSASPSDGPKKPSSTLPALAESCVFKNAQAITNETFTLALRRIGDKNVLSHVHVMLVFISRLASSTYVSDPVEDVTWAVSDLINDIPWAELIAFLNTLVKTEKHIQSQSQNQTQNIDTLLAANVFPGEGERSDELPLPEDYLIRGLIWTHEYFPEKWFDREHDEEERTLELASTVKNRTERVLRLGFSLCKHQRWITYDSGSNTFAVRSQ
ncbi:telomerase-binding protein est1a protein [Stemphylium lycopersici]|nr:telomerase-binding protein est1a protein [Stemphylium lycopersici]